MHDSRQSSTASSSTSTPAGGKYVTFCAAHVARRSASEFRPSQLVHSDDTDERELATAWRRSSPQPMARPSSEPNDRASTQLERGGGDEYDGGGAHAGGEPAAPSAALSSAS